MALRVPFAFFVSALGLGVMLLFFSLTSFVSFRIPGRARARTLTHSCSLARSPFLSRACLVLRARVGFLGGFLSHFAPAFPFPPPLSLMPFSPLPGVGLWLPCWLVFP